MEKKDAINNAGGAESSENSEQMLIETMLNELLNEKKHNNTGGTIFGGKGSVIKYKELMLNRALTEEEKNAIPEGACRIDINGLTYLGEYE